jgi:hypothetical protein
MPQLLDKPLIGVSLEERSNDVGVSHVGQLSALPRNASMYSWRVSSSFWQ